MSVEWITHKGRKILYIKYGGLSLPEQLEQIRKAARMIVETRSRDNLTLSDIRDAPLTKEFMETAKEQGKLSGPYTKKAAIVGVEGVRKILLQTVNTVSGNPRVPFPTLEAAKDWLAE